MPIPGIPDLTNLEDQLRNHMNKAGLNATTLAAQMAAWGWGSSTWSAVHVTSILNGTAKLTEPEQEFVTQFLLHRFYTYNCT